MFTECSVVFFKFVVRNVDYRRVVSNAHYVAKPQNWL